MLEHRDAESKNLIARPNDRQASGVAALGITVLATFLALIANWPALGNQDEGKKTPVGESKQIIITNILSDQRSRVSVTGRYTLPAPGKELEEDRDLAIKSIEDAILEFKKQQETKANGAKVSKNVVEEEQFSSLEKLLKTLKEQRGATKIPKFEKLIVYVVAGKDKPALSKYLEPNSYGQFVKLENRTGDTFDFSFEMKGMTKGSYTAILYPIDIAPGIIGGSKTFNFEVK
jgi:hypothetical protein